MKAFPIKVLASKFQNSSPNKITQFRGRCADAVGLRGCHRHNRKPQRSAAHPGRFLWVAVSQQWDTLGMTEGLMWTSRHGFLSTHMFRSFRGLYFPLAGRGVPTGLRVVQKKNQHCCFILRGLRDTEQDLEHEPQCPPHHDL